ncbi:UPF0547 protein C16orf87 homolog [Pollicipes pollicipes]|uniref:UPF0547 protein C16orf87 homolog n=1 Tax=Pollicipes pollicipes TaxID=41117 RepID=UPI00188552EE|nr:UPF0547 protein C16orf87 homolog [Pollicipes pollicipes]
MPKKSVTKECPGCERQLPVACKTCPCGHSFRKPSDSTSVPTRLSSSSKEGESPARRRTERVKREKPKFYDASQYERAPRKRKPKVIVEPEVKKVRIDERRSFKEKEKEREDNGAGAAGEEQEIVYEDIMADATREETAKYAIVLSEINRKLAVVNPTF